MYAEQYDVDREDENETTSECVDCKGTGVIDIGDCEDGVQDECPVCLGVGRIND